jgi:excisionase family DNA binding protein
MPALSEAPCADSRSNEPLPPLKFHRISEIVEITGLSRGTIAVYLRTGRLKSTKLGQARLIADAELRAFLDSGE